MCFDLVVVGAGIAGLYTALEMKRRSPHATVALVDRAQAGKGATAYAPGIQVAYGRDDVERALAERGIDAWRRTFDECAIGEARQCDLIWMTQYPGPLMERHLRHTLGEIQLEQVSDKLRSLPPLKWRSGVFAFFDRGCYSPSDPVATDLRERLVELGCIFFEGVAATAVIAREDRVTVLRRDNECVEGRAAVVAIGPWAPGSALLDGLEFHVRASLRVKKVVALHLHTPPTPDCAAVVWLDDYAFLIPFVEGGYWLLSFTSQHWDVTPDEPLTVNADDFAIATSIIERWLPDLTPLIGPARVFCDCYSRNGLPLVARHRESERVAYICAGSGNGFRFAPPCAEDALALVGIAAV